ncbi:MAG: archaellin/type IV pilin N-terminal domain-containing protein [Candidatus Bathyarchaeia archaeon]
MKLLRSRKALSPVVASIILIAVTVAVSLAVAAFMGAIPGRYMNQPTLSITSMSFTGNGASITINVTNTGTAIGTVSYVKVNGNSTTFSPAPANIQPGSTVTITVNFAWTSGQRYMVSLYAQSGELLTAREEYAPS